MERRDSFEEISLENLAIKEMRGRNRGGKNPLCQGPVSEEECKPMFGGDLDITLEIKLMSWFLLRQEVEPAFRDSFQDLGEFAYYTRRQCFPQCIMTQQWVKKTI